MFKSQLDLPNGSSLAVNHLFLLPGTDHAALVCTDGRTGMPIVFDLTGDPNFDLAGTLAPLSNVGEAKILDQLGSTDKNHFTAEIDGEVYTIDFSNPNGDPRHPMIINDVPVATINLDGYDIAFDFDTDGNPASVVVVKCNSAE